MLENYDDDDEKFQNEGVYESYKYLRLLLLLYYYYLLFMNQFFEMIRSMPEINCGLIFQLIANRFATALFFRKTAQLQRMRFFNTEEEIALFTF